jgi:hypothetical protein
MRLPFANESVRIWPRAWNGAIVPSTLYADSRLDEATYREQSARLDREIKELKDELARLEPDHLNVPEFR